MLFGDDRLLPSLFIFVRAGLSIAGIHLTKVFYGVFSGA